MVRAITGGGRTFKNDNRAKNTDLEFTAKPTY